MGRRTEHGAIDGNSRDGLLYRDSSVRRGKSGKFVGYRRTAKGKFESRIFTGTEANVKAEWREWQREVSAATTITVETRAKRQTTREEDGSEVAMATTAKANAAKSEATEVYVVQFIGQYETKNVAAFHDLDAATKIVDGLTVALDASAAKGQYDVFKLPLWG